MQVREPWERGRQARRPGRPGCDVPPSERGQPHPRVALGRRLRHQEPRHLKVRGQASPPRRVCPTEHG